MPKRNRKGSKLRYPASISNIESDANSSSDTSVVFDGSENGTSHGPSFDSLRLFEGPAIDALQSRQGSRMT